MDELSTIADLYRTETALNELEHALLWEPDPQKEATRNQLHVRRANLIRAIHAAEVHRLEATGLLPPGCDDPNCEPCYAHNIGALQRLGNQQKNVRWNAALQAWQRRTWREATPAEIAAYEADQDDDATPPERYRAWKTCWKGAAYGAPDDPPQIRWNRHLSQYEAEEWQ